jgi:hypothetical protein
VKELLKNGNLREKLEEYLKCPRLVMYDNGDRIKYNSVGEIEWVFSPRYGWNKMSKEIIEEITRYQLKWDLL